MKSRFFFILVFLFFTQVKLWANETISKISFIQDGEISKLIIDTTGVVVAEKYHMVDNKQILLDLKGVVADNKVLRAIDTSEFSGSTVYVSAFYKDGSENEIRLVVQLRDNVQSRLNLLENRIILDIENRYGVFADSNDVPVEENIEQTRGINIPKSNSILDILENLTLAGNKKYVGRRISINVKDLSISELLNMIADTSGFNIIVDSEVVKRPNMTITLTNIPWDEALDTILKLNKLVADKHSNILQIKTEEKYITEKQAEVDAQEKLKKQDPLVTKVFPISFAKLPDIISVISKYKSTTGETLMDERTSNLIIKDTVENIEKMRKIIELLDTPTPQVLIEAKIVEVEETESFGLGFDEGGLAISYNQSGISDPGVSFGLNPASGIFNGATAVFKDKFGLDFILKLQEQDSKVKVISSPRIVTQNKETATIQTAESKKILVDTVTDANGNQLPNFEDVTANLSLNVTPQVSNDGTIALKIKVSKGEFGADAREVTNNDITTNVLVDNGSTVVIGGLYKTKNTNQEIGIPGLKNIPLLGWLFKSNVLKLESRRELIVFITPRIIKAGENVQASVE